MLTHCNSRRRALQHFGRGECLPVTAPADEGTAVLQWLGNGTLALCAVHCPHGGGDEHDLSPTDGGHRPRSRPEAAAVPPDAGEASGCRQHLASSGDALQPSVEDPWEREGVEEQAEQEERQRLR